MRDLRGRRVDAKRWLLEMKTRLRVEVMHPLVWIPWNSNIRCLGPLHLTPFGSALSCLLHCDCSKANTKG